MAFSPRKISPLDLKPSTGVGIDLPFNGPTGINTTYTTKDAVKANLLNFILTVLGIVNKLLVITVNILFLVR